jgi:hypothetical protein
MVRSSKQDFALTTADDQCGDRPLKGGGSKHFRSASGIGADKLLNDLLAKCRGNGNARIYNSHKNRLRLFYASEAIIVS